MDIEELLSDSEVKGEMLQSALLKEKILHKSPNSQIKAANTNKNLENSKRKISKIGSVLRYANKSVSIEEANKILVGLVKLKDEPTPLSVKNLTDWENLLSVFELANDFVDDLIKESFKKLHKSIEDPSKAEARNLDKHKNVFFIKSSEAQKEQPSMFNFANSFVDNILKESRRRVDNLNILGVERFQKYSAFEDFKVKDGLEIIAKFISKWSFNPNWYYKTMYHGRMTSETHSYFYTVRWSVPTPNYPVAQVTVDVNFTIEVIEMKSPPVSIEVWYRVETDRSQHNISSTFLEKWINSVVTKKLLLFKKLKF